MTSENYKISTTINPSTSECKWSLQCLEVDGRPIGNVLSHIRPKIIFVDCDKQKECVHKIIFCKSIICQCPIRNQLYFNYKI